MEPRANSRKGFSLIEVAVAVAIIAILAGALAPLALKAVNQAREQRTRGELKTAYEALFGARDRRVSNMRADFGYAGASLSQMTQQGAIRAYGPYASPSALTGGWNGPYWTGMQDVNGFPLDAWGRPLQLRFISGGYQLLSLGDNGILNSPGQNPQGDDLVYPLPPNPLPVTSLQVNLHQLPGGGGGGGGGKGGKGSGTPPANGSVTVYTPSTTNTAVATALLQSTPGLFASPAIPSGNAVVSASVPGFPTQAQAVNLAQGGTVTLDFYF